MAARVLAVAGALLSAAATAQAADVTVYRCTDSRGQLVALRDSPCRSGERQETVTMQRPQDPPARSASTATPAPASPAAAPRDVRVVTVQAPTPMYECTAPDGTTYLSETDQVADRWVPLWTLGYPVRPGLRPPSRPSLPPVRPATQVASGASPAHGAGARPPPLPGVVAPAGTWVRDSCMRLSQDEVCSRLSDRRYEILRIYHAAMPSRREELDREQRGIDAHMADHCPGY
ncbi:hypothetical protein H1235_16410 [Pseudoxanthomonas sp. NC8]|nr:hypothetical protein H1235_16410 [Pseudoxanthomonas sp. NC8]